MRTKLFLTFFIGLFLIHFISAQEQTLHIENKPVPSRFRHINVPPERIVIIFKAPDPIKIINQDLAEDDPQKLEDLGNGYYKYTFLYFGSNTGNLWIKMGNTAVMLQYGPHLRVKKNLFFPKRGLKGGDLVYFEISRLKKFFVNIEEESGIQMINEGDASIRFVIIPPDFKVTIKSEPYLKYEPSYSNPQKGIYFYLVPPEVDSLGNFIARKITLYAPGYEPFIKEFYFKPKDAYKITIKETVKSSISIPAKAFSQNTKVYIDGKYVGKLPVSHYSVDPGHHTIKLENPYYFADREVYSVDVGKNEHISFDKYRFSQYKDVTIRTEPVKGAMIYIDGQMQKKKSDLTVKLTKGEHTIRALKQNFEPATRIVNVNEATKEILITLDRGSYYIKLESEPHARVYVDNELKGTTPVEVDMQYGKHKVLFTAPGYISQRKTVYAKATNGLVYAKLFPSQFTLIGLDIGRSQWGFALTLVYERIMVRGKWHFNYNHNRVDSSEVRMFNAKVNDISSYKKPYGKLISGHNYNFGGSLGYLFSKPIPFVIHGGVLYIQPDDYYPAYKAKHSYTDTYGSVVLEKGDIFTYPKEKTPEGYLIYTAGIDFYIKKFLYIGAEYYTDSEVGPGISFSIGYVQDLNKLYNAFVDAYNSRY